MQAECYACRRMFDKKRIGTSLPSGVLVQMCASCYCDLMATLVHWRENRKAAAEETNNE